MKLIPWAYTKLKAFETCPRQGYARYVTKSYPFVETPAMKEGNRVHKAFELRINDDVALPNDLVKYEPLVPTYMDSTVLLHAEPPLAVTIDGEPCGFWDSIAWFRGKLDVLDIEGDTCFVIDWKTGKPWEDADELQCHAAITKVHFPEVKHWRGMYVWLRENRIGEVHTLSPAKTLERLHDRIERVKVEDTPRKNPLCAWCNLKSCELHPEYER